MGVCGALAVLVNDFFSNGETYKSTTGCTEDHDLQNDKDWSLQEMGRVELVLFYHERMVNLSKAEGDETDAPKNPEGDLGSRIPFIIGSSKADSLWMVNLHRRAKGSLFLLP